MAIISHAQKLKEIEDNKGLLIRRERYMARNNNGSYSVTDFTLLWLARDILEKMNQEILAEMAKEQRRKIYDKVKVIESKIILTNPRVVSDIIYDESDVRDLTIELYHQECKWIKALITAGVINERYDSPTVSPKDKLKPEMSLIITCENAARQDIVRGYKEDFTNMLSYFKSLILLRF